MKYINSIFWLIVASGLVISCAKETPGKEDIVTPEKEQTTPDKEVTDLDPSEYLLGFGVAIEDQDTKVTINPESGAMAFEDGDHALVVSGTGCGEYVYSASDGSFSPVDVSNAIPMASSGISVYYPFDAFELSGSDVIFKMPAYIQSLTDLGGKNPLAAQVVVDDVNGGYKATFKSVCSILQVSITGNRKLSSVELSNTNSMPFASASEFTVTWSDNNPVITSASTGNTMSIESDAELSDTPAVFYFILPAGISFNGVAVTANMTTADAGGFTSFTVTRGDWTPVRNKIFKMDFFAGLFSGGAGTTENPYKIANARDFKHIKTYTTDGYGTLDADHFLAAKYQQTADINFGADADHKSNLTSYMIGTSAAPFTGKYDGHNHSLNYFSLSGTYPVGLFQHIGAATIDDVVVSGFSVSATKQAGAIVGYVNGASAVISNCEASNGSVTGTDGELGGIVGRTQTAAEITDCINRASVTNNTNNKNNIGGILGYANTNVTISGCSNYGTIDNQTYGQVGGIIGKCNATLTLSGCKNYGVVNAAGGIVGGIVGIMGGYSGSSITEMTSSVSDCYNEGTVIAAAGKNYCGGIVGRVYGGVISLCRNNGHVGAFSVDSEGAISATNATVQYVGGIVGLLNSGVVDKCYSGTNNSVNPVVTLRGTAIIGGIVGSVQASYDQPAVVINCFSRATIHATNSGSAPLGGIVGYLYGKSASALLYNCMVWGTSKLYNLSNGNSAAYIGGLVGRIGAESGKTADVRNCLSAQNYNYIYQKVNGSNADLSSLNHNNYQNYGVIFGHVEGDASFRDVYYRKAFSGGWFGKHDGNKSNNSTNENMSTGVTENQAKNIDNVSFSLFKSTSLLYSFSGNFDACLTRGTKDPDNASQKLYVEYNGSNYEFSDWASNSNLSNYPVQTVLSTKGTDFYTK